VSGGIKMKITIKIGEVEVTIAEEHQLTKRSYDEDMHLKCRTIAQELYEKYMEDRKTQAEDLVGTSVSLAKEA
jgi:hypothetical protein